MKVTKIIILFFLVFTLVACVQKDQEGLEDITLELIGDATIIIEEGMEFEDPGVLVNGEKMIIGYYSTLNRNKIGTYYIKYDYYGEEILRTVEVVEGAKTHLLQLVEDLNSSTNFSYTLDLDSRFTRAGTNFHTFLYEDYDIYGDFLHGTTNRTSFQDGENTQMIEITQNDYIFIDKVNKNEEYYSYDEYSMWYQEHTYYPSAETSVTDFQLDGVRSVTREVIDNQTIYTAYLNSEDYRYAYNMKINMIPNELFDFEVDDYITIVITVEEDHIIKIETDLTQIMKDAIHEASDAIPTEYHYVYTFSNYDSVEPIIIPDEGIQAKNK